MGREGGSDFEPAGCPSRRLNFRPVGLSVLLARRNADPDQLLFRQYGEVMELSNESMLDDRVMHGLRLKFSWGVCSIYNCGTSKHACAINTIIYTVLGIWCQEELSGCGPSQNTVPQKFSCRFIANESVPFHATAVLTSIIMKISHRSRVLAPRWPGAGPNP